MFGLFDLLDRACDALAHAFDSKDASADVRSRPQVMFILLALVLVPCVIYLGWELSPWLLGVLGLIAALASTALYVIWTR